MVCDFFELGIKTKFLLNFSPDHYVQKAKWTYLNTNIDLMQAATHKIKYMPKEAFIWHLFYFMLDVRVA